MKLAHRIDSLLHAAIERRIFPGAVVLVAQGATLRHLAAYGTTMYAEPGSRSVDTGLCYDIASLTKVFTATAALRLWERGALDLDTPAATYLPELRAGQVLVRHLLTHTSGLDLRLSAAARDGRAALLDAIYAAPLRQAPGTLVAYTNINSLLLGEIVARLYGRRLDEAIAALVTEPLGLAQTRFQPDESCRSRIAPSEIDSEWRGGLVHGQVHDESAHALGGVAGHAGLFSSAADLHRFCCAWLVGERPERAGQSAQAGPRLLQAETIRLATRNHTPELGLACGLGWMIDRPNFMGMAPAGTFGHTGFTGPAIAVVASERLIVVMLSNRTFPQRGAALHHAITAGVIQAALDDRKE
jgi:CubicO group peptidase (beta-lactamase class C family)